MAEVKSNGVVQNGLSAYLTCHSKGITASTSLEHIELKVKNNLSTCCTRPVFLSCRDPLCRELSFEKPFYQTVSKCHNRICRKPACIKARVVRTRKKYIPKGRQLKQPRFMTLTLKSRMALCAESKVQVDYAFKMLMQYLKRGNFVTRYIKAVEVVRKGNLWQFHIHVIYEGRYIHKPRLSMRWKQYSGNSYIVDISQVKGRIPLIHYITKYITKGNDVDITLKQYMLIRKLRFFASGGRFEDGLPEPVYDKLICPICKSRMTYDHFLTQEFFGTLP